MMFPLVAALLFLLPSLAVSLVWLLVQWLRKRPVGPVLRTAAWLQPTLLVVHLFVTFPCLLGWFGSRGLGTRHDERAWQGPRVTADGGWQLQSRASLRAEATAPPPAAVVAGAGALALRVPIADGLSLRAFRVPATVQPPRAVVLLVHGLFRSAMEIEAPAAMLRRAGCECFLLEQRNHGGSDRAPATFGLRESEDVVAAVRFVRAQPGCERAPLLLYGVSLGTVSLALALPHLDDVAGVVLDAPVDDLLATAHRMLGLQRAGDRRSFFAMWEPWRSLVLASLQAWSGFELAQVRPAASLQGLSASLPVLLIGGEHDDKVPVGSVQALFDSLPMPVGVKELWLAPGAGHGDAFTVDADDYERRLRAFVQRVQR